MQILEQTYTKRVTGCQYLITIIGKQTTYTHSSGLVCSRQLEYEISKSNAARNPEF